MSKRTAANAVNQSNNKRMKNGDTTNVLQSTTLKELLVSKEKEAKTVRRVVSMQHNQTIEDAFKTLQENHILAAPVLMNASLEDSDDAGTYMGMVDVHSMMRYIVKDYVNMKFDTVRPKAGDKEAWKYLLKEGADFMQTKLVVVTGNDSNYILHDQEGMSVLELIMRHFKKRDGTATHRVIVFSPRGHINHIVTQSDIVHFLAQHPGCLGELGSRTMSELGFVLGDVISIDQQVWAADAFALMFQKGVSAIALTGEDGVLVGNLSASDMKGMSASEFPLLLQPASKFLKLEQILHAQDKKKAAVKTPDSLHPLAIAAEVTLTEAIKRLAEKRIHRLYICQNGKAVGVITLTDIMMMIAANITL